MCTGEVWPSGLGLPQGARSLLPPGLLGTVEAQEIPLETLDGSFAQLGARPTEEAAGWRARGRGLHSPSRIDFDDFDLLPGGDLGPFAEGHILRWMMDRGVPIGPVRLSVATHYAGSLIYAIVEGLEPELPILPPIFWHCFAMDAIGRLSGPLSFGEELLHLAWAVDQLDQECSLARCLESRDVWRKFSAENDFGGQSRF